MKRVLCGVATIALAIACVEPKGDEGTREAGLEGEVCIGAEPFEGPALTLGQLQVLLGTIPFYVQNMPLLYTGAWTNWSSDPLETALAKLAAMRVVISQLLAHNTYPAGTLQGYPGDDQLSCPPAAAGARTADGSCNDLDGNPLMGAANTRFGRNLPLAHSHPDADLLEPNPREISRRILARTDHKEMDFLNMLGAAWTQFQIHDWFSHGDNDASGLIQVPLTEDDPLAQKYGLASLPIRRTLPDPTYGDDDAAAGIPPTYLNTVTHWWDGSQIYGSDAQTAARLRTSGGNGAKLRLLGNGLLPPRAGGASDAGFTDNWWLGLELLHTLFAMEHNAIVDHLGAHYPSMSEQELYDKARLINTALIARIHTLEWTPAILPNPSLRVGMHTNWAGLNQFLGGQALPYLPPHLLEPATGIPASAHPIIYGVVGSPRDLGGAPYFLTEEFVSVYRMHPMLPEELVIRSLDGNDTPIETRKTRNKDARKLVQNKGLDNLLYSFGTQNSGALVLQNYPHFLQDLIMPFGVIDVGTIDIVRDRERGIPRYNLARQLMALRPVSSFEELTGGDQALADLLSDVYGGDIDKVDFMVGMLAEGVRPDCYGFSETAFQIFTLMATRRLQNDRFFTTDFHAGVYTAEGIAWVQGNTMKSVLLRHFPQLAATRLGDDGFTNAFMPWN